MPREVHEHQDKHGNLTGFTVVTRESEWDQSSLERAQRLDEYERSLCPCGCGVPVDKAWDPFFEPWSVDEYTCYARRALEDVRRKWEQRHKDDREGWADGIEHFVVAPEDGGHNAEAAAAAEAKRLRRQAPGGD